MALVPPLPPHTFWYVATPYTNYPLGREAAFKDASQVAARLVVLGFPIFCPISHSHPLAETGQLPHADHELWMRLDRPFMHAAHGLIVVTMPGWRDSAGVTEERKFFRERGKPIIYYDPATEIMETSE